MTEKLQQFLDEYYKNYNKFTYGHYLDPDNQDALKTGLVGCFYLNQAYRPEKRQAIGNALSLYDKYWGDKLNSGYFDDNPNQLFSYQDINLTKKLELIRSAGSDALSIYWSSVDNLDFTPSYMINIFSIADWFEVVHKPLTYIQFYFPITELEHFGIEKLVEFVQQISDILQPIHGFFGLGIQHSHEYSDYQYLEYELAHKFLGLDISNVESDLNFREGFKCINWLTVLSDELINNKLGGLSQLKQNNHDEGITFYPYSGGVVVRAGEVPELGDVATNPYPQHYVNVNALLKAARAPEIGSLGFGSINGEIRFNNRTSKEWQSRFDDVLATDIPVVNKEILDSINQVDSAVRISLKTGDLCRHSGLYSTTINGRIEYRELVSGYKVESFIDSETQQEYTDVTWQLLRRDDGGDVFIKND